MTARIRPSADHPEEHLPVPAPVHNLAASRRSFRFGLQFSDGAKAASPRPQHIKINAVTPGYTATDMNRGQGTPTVSEGAVVIAQFAPSPTMAQVAGFTTTAAPSPGDLARHVDHCASRVNA